MKLKSYLKIENWKLKIHRRKIIGFISTLLVLALSALVFLKLTSPSVQAAWFDDTYSYRQKTTISNAGSAQTDFQVSISMDTATLITAGKMQSDCDDVRVTDAGGILLSHVIEEGSAPCNNAATKIWVKIPSIPTTTQVLYLYYGNPAAASAENGKAVFDFFDNFSTAQSVWTATGATSLSGGALTITTGAVYTNAAILASSTSYMYEYRAQWSSTVANYAGMMINNTQSAAGGNSEGDKLIYIMSNATTNIAQRGWANDTGTSYNLANNMTLYTPTAATYYIDGFSMDSSQIKFWNNGSQVGTTVTGTWTGAPAPYLWLGYFTGSVASTTNITDITVDWVRARKFASTAPSASTAGSEEQGPAPISYWSFDEAQGGTANDFSSGSNNDLTITNAAWRTSDLCVFGNCLYFDGTNDKAIKTYSSDSEFDPGTSSFSVSTWFKHSSTAGIDFLVTRFSSGGWKINMNSSGNMCFGITDDVTWVAEDLACSTLTYNDSQWHHLVAVKSTTASITIYIDGQQAGQDASLLANTSISGSSPNFNVGVDSDGSSASWDGFIDEVKYYNFAKTANQIKAEFISKSAPKGTSASFGAGDASHSLSQGLVGYWKMDETSWTIDCATASVTDSSGNGNNGASCPATTGPAGGASGKFGNAGSFDGTNDYIKISEPANNLFDLTNNFSLAAWIYPTSITTGNQGIIDKLAGGGSYRLQLSSSQVCMAVRASDGTYDETCSTLPANNQWYHVVGIVSDGKLYVYVNGSLGNSKSTAVQIANTNYDLWIGRTQNNNVTLNGSIDDVRIYNRALTPSEVEGLSNFAPGPVGWWKMDENTGTSSINDSSGNGLTGTMSGLTSSGWTQGKFGSALKFDGVDDKITVSDNDVLDLTSKGTWSAWIYGNDFGDNPDDEHSFIAKRTGTDSQYQLLVSNSDTPTVQLYMNDAQRFVSTGTLAEKQWYFVAITFDRPTIKFYLNGVLDSTGTYDANIDPGAHSLTISTKNETLSEMWNGMIDDVRIYNYARTPKQIVEDMNAGHPAGGSPISSSVIHWKLDEATGTTANNSGTDDTLDGTATGTAWRLENSTSGGCKLNGCINIDTATDDVTRSDPAFFDSLTGMTASFWLNPQTLAVTNAIVSKSNTSQETFLIQTDATNSDEIRVYIADTLTDTANYYTTNNANLTAAATYANWQHITVVYDATAAAADRVKVYKNGRLLSGSVTGTIPSDGLTASSANFQVGESHKATSGLLAYIDEVKIYNFALSPSEILVDANASSAAALGGILGTHDSEGFSGNPPIGWWKLDENTGTSANDSSGNLLTGTLTGGPIWIAGKVGPAIEFDGSNDYVTAGVTSTLRITGNVSFGAWFRADTIGDSEGIIYQGGGTGDTEAENELYILRFDTTSGNDLEYKHESGAGANTGLIFDVNLSTGTWYHAMFVRDVTANTVTLYLNGAQQGSSKSYTNDPTGGTSGYFDIGTETRVGFCDCTIDNVLVYNYTLTPAQIAYVYNRGAPVVHLKFDECQGATANNSAPAAAGGDPGLDASINSSTTGTNIAVGSCESGNTNEMWANGRVGKYNASLDWDGSNDYVLISNASGIDMNEGLQNGFTYSAWFNADSAGEGTGGMIFLKAAWCRTDTLSGSNLDIECFLDLTTTDRSVNISSAVTTGTWNHVALTWTNDSDDDITVYINGVQRGASTNNSNDTVLADGTHQRVGNNTSESATFDGDIDDFYIFNYELTAAQIKRLYNEGSAQRFGPATGSP